MVNNGFEFETLPFWSKLTENEKELVKNNARYVKYEKGAIILGSENECLGLLLVVEGSISAYMLSEEGREIMLFRTEKGGACVLSASCVLRQITFDVQLTAEEETEVVIINAQVFSFLTNQNIYVECYAYKQATERFSDVMWAMQQLLFYGFDRRLAIYLYEESIRCGCDSLKLTHEKIAKSIGSAREVVTRMLNQFADKKIVALGRGTVTITDRAKLKKLL